MRLYAAVVPAVDGRRRHTEGPFSREEQPVSVHPLFRRFRSSRVVLSCFLATACFSLFNCSALNPAFVDLFDTTGQLATIENAPGHLVIAFVNNAEVDEQLLNFLTTSKPEGGGVELTNAELRSLRPRIRFRVLIEFVDGSVNTFEFVSGSSKLVDQEFNQQADPDLNENDLEHFVVVCDVAQVSILGNIEVFVPVEIEQWRLVVPELGGNAFFVKDAENSPDGLQFIALETDVVDGDQNIILQQNIGIRDAPVPVSGPACGAVIAFVVKGTLSVPFATGVPTDQPAVRVDDPQSIASIGGRYEIEVQIR